MTSSIPPQEYQTTIWNLILNADESCALAALILYEHVVTLSKEVNTMWKNARFSAVSVLFQSTRLVLLMNAIQAVTSPTSLARSALFILVCRRGTILGDTLKLIGFAQVAVFSALRIFALSQRVELSLLTLIVSLVPVGTNMFHNIRATIVYTSWSQGCGESLYISQRENDMYVYKPGITRGYLLTISRFLYVTRGSAILGDIIVLAVTWSQTINRWRVLKSFGFRTTLSFLIFRDGTIYFVVLLGLNVAQLITYRLPRISTTDPVTIIIENLVGSVALAIMSILTSHWPQILLCRFIMNLRQANQAEHDLATVSSLAFVAPQTNSRIVANMGEPLIFDEEVYGDEGDVVDSAGDIAGRELPA